MIFPEFVLFISTFGCKSRRHSGRVKIKREMSVVHFYLACIYVILNNLGESFIKIPFAEWTFKIRKLNHCHASITFAKNRKLPLFNIDFFRWSLASWRLRAAYALILFQ